MEAAKADASESKAALQEVKDQMKDEMKAARQIKGKHERGDKPQGVLCGAGPMEARTPREGSIACVRPKILRLHTSYSTLRPRDVTQPDWE